ncbi:MAG: glycosyltransferase family 4 protein [Candidatus Dormibacteraceae bacterium]
MSGFEPGGRPLSILIVTPSLPYPPIWGFGIRVYQIIRGLSRRNRVWLCCYGGREGDDAAVAALGRFCEGVTVVPVPEAPRRTRRRQQVATALSTGSYHRRRLGHRGMQQAIDRLLAERDFDVVQVESSHMAGFDFSAAPVVVLDEHNLEYELLRRASGIERSPVRRLYARFEAAKVFREERRSWSSVSGCIVTSERERAIVETVAPRLATAVVPNGVDTDYFRPADIAADPDGLVLTGLMTYRPNADGAVHFARDILPIVRRARPQATFTAVGWGLPAGLKPLLDGGTRSTGRVPDVRPYLSAAAAVVVPIRMGGGTRLKVLDGLAMARPMVSTRLGCEGLNVRDREHLLVADGAEAFAGAVVELLRNPASAAEMGRRGRALVAARYDWPAIIESLEGFHHRVLGARGGTVRTRVPA